MSRRHRPTSPRAQARVRVGRYLRKGLAKASFVALGGTILCVMLAIAMFSSGQSPALASGTGQGTPPPGGRQGTIQTTCGGTGLPACAPIEGWIPLHSPSGADIIAAAKKSTLFHVDRTGKGDFLKDISHLGVPQLVQALHVAGKANAPDFYVIPIEDASSGQTVGSAELQLNTAHTAVEVVAIITYIKPYAANSITWMTPAAAVAAVQAQHHVGLNSGAKPRLVYIPGDTAAQPTGTAHWVVSQSPAEPDWAVPGADGQDHIVDANGHAHLPSELPMAAT